MSSTSATTYTSEPLSPPPLSRTRPSRRRRQLPLPPEPEPPKQPDDTTDYPHRPGKEPADSSSPSPKRRRVSVQDDQEPSITDILELRPEAKELFDSNDLLHLQTLVKEFAESPNQNTRAKALLNLCAHQYPNAFSLMLAHLLYSPIPPHVRNQTIALLHRILNEIHAKDMSRIHRLILLRLKPLLLNYLKLAYSLIVIVDLSEVICNVASRIYEIPNESWEELLEYLISSMDMDLESRQEMALKMFLGLPEESDKCPHLSKFWESNFQSLYSRIWELFDSPNQNIQALTFDASVRLVGMVNNLVTSYAEIDYLLPRMIEFLTTVLIGGKTDIVLPRLKVLAHLAKYKGEFFERYLNDVFQFVLQIAETANVSTDVRCAAMQILKELDDGAMDEMSLFMMQLSEDNSRRLFTLCLHMMLCIEDDPAWYDVDSAWSKLAGTSDSYRLGMFILDRLCFEGHESIVIPLGIEIIPTYLCAEDWQTRHAGMITFGALGEGCSAEMMRYTDHAERLLEISLNDPHPRVCWAAIDAIRCISSGYYSEDGQPAAHARYLNKFLAKLVTIIKGSHYSRVKAHAALAIRFLANNCVDDEVISVFEDIVTELLKLVKQDEQKLQEEAVETLKSVANSFPAYFRRYYYVTMDTLKAALSHSSSQTKLLFRAKCIECMSNIVLGFEQDGSRDGDAIQAMEALLSLGRNLRETDHSIKVPILKALSQFCKLPEMIIGTFFDAFMPILIQSAKLNVSPENTANTSHATSDHILAKTERALACEMLSYCAGRFRERFAPRAAEVSQIFTRLLDCSDTETLRASVTAIPKLLLSAQSSLMSQSFTVILTVHNLVEALSKERNKEMRITMLESLNGCIQISGSVLPLSLNKLIADEISQILIDQQSLRSLDIERGEEAETSEEGDEQDQGDELIHSANCLMTMIETLKYGFSPHVDELVPTVVLLWGDASPNKVKAIAISIYKLLVRQYPDKLQMYHETYASALLDACQSESPLVQMEVARWIGLCATFRGHIFKIDANVAINRLYFVIEQGNASDSDRAKTYDVAVSALGKICEFYRDSINGPQVVPTWLKFLPLRSDCTEARYAHEQLCNMLARLDKDLLGPNNINLPKVLEVLTQVLIENQNLATEETTSQIIQLLSQYGAMP